MRVDGNTIRDARNRPILLYGANAETLFLNTTAGEAQSVFFTMRSWNMNAARVFSSITDLQKDPDRHLAQLARLAEMASTQQIVLIIALVSEPTTRHKLPTAAALAHWKSVATQLKDAPGVIFDLFDDPSFGDGVGEPSGAAWKIWREGGIVDGEQYIGMQALAGVIRAAGATQLIIAEGLGGVFSNIGDNLLSDSSVIYAARESLAESGRAAGEWGRSFGFLAGRVPSR